MGKRDDASAAEASVPELLKGIVANARELIGQQLELLRAEVREEVHKVESAAISMGAGIGLAALGGVLTAHMLVHALHRGLGLPLWGCYGVVGGAATVAGVELVQHARRQAAGLRLVPRETTKALQENVAWLHAQAGAVTN